MYLRELINMYGWQICTDLKTDLDFPMDEPVLTRTKDMRTPDELAKVRSQLHATLKE